MSIGKWLALALVVATASGAHAQQNGGFYGMGHYDWISGKTVQGYNVNGGNGTANNIGGTFGVFYDFLKLGPINLGGDIRYSFSHSGTPSAYGNALTYGDLGVRVSGHIPAIRLRPYVQAGVLEGSTNYAEYNSMHGGFGYGYQVGGDIPVFPHFDARIEYAGGNVGNLRSNIGTTNINFNQISGGFVIWFGDR